MLCSISGVVPTDPVFSKTGYVFERSAVVKYIETEGKCPHTGEPLTVQDLIPIKESKITKPRVAQATSIPGMLQMFQNEWDSLMLETFTLRQHLETVRQELAQALYQHDAACRVIARLIKERDAARNALATAHAQIATGDSGRVDMDIDHGIITEELKARITLLSKQLSQERKKRATPASLRDPSRIQSYTVLSSHPIHKASEPGILALDIHPTDQNKIVTGGADKTVVLFDRAQSKKVLTFTGHKKKISSVQFHPAANVLFSSSYDNTARIWRYNDNEVVSADVLKAHTGPVVGVSLHPTNDHLATGSSDGYWAFHDINTLKCLAHVACQEKAPVSSIKFHPDGAILGTGTEDSFFRIWDIRTQQNAVIFGEQTGKIVDVAFAENGYFAASASENGVVKLWDLRKLKSYNSIELGHSVTSIDFDYSATYLLVAGTDLRVFHAKNAEIVHTFEHSSGLITDAKFGADASFIALTSLDRNLKFLG